MTICEHSCACGNKWWSRDPDERCSRCLQSELTAARDEAKRLRGRVSELEAAVESLRTAGNRVISYGQPLTEWAVAVQNALYPEEARKLRAESDELEKPGDEQ